MKLLAGTSKGLVIYERKSGSWELLDIQFTGFPVSMLFVDERNGYWWVGVSHRHWGQKLHYSTDEGKNWETVPTPSYSDYEYRPGKKVPLKKIWVMQGAGEDKPGCLWLGTEPGGLFYSDDNGKNFELVEGLWNHSSRMNDMEWFGAGKDYPFIHSIVVNPQNSDHVYIGVSCAGVFETKDAGKKWIPKNNGLRAAYLPNPKAEVGHDPHLLLMNQDNPQVIWQQNHCGIFKTDNAGENWFDVSGKDQFPYYGFGLAIGEDEKTAWVIPAESDEKRIPKDLELAVYKTVDAGKSWQAQLNGLPNPPVFEIVLRHSFVRQDKTLAFGTNNGNLYLSDNEGENWFNLSNHLTSVNFLLLTKK